ncbi:sensor histidine kinase [Nocardioides caldifontis]|uniref:sensor histidine kinase n=1 Tax=Nocardioides caldifontis TaxID=2588938 RepID=UPI0011DF40C0|nr:sensor histidine kinase [Nocardioides caldifontis]
MAPLTSTAPAPGAARDPVVAATVDWLVVLGVAAVASTGLGLEQPWDGSGWSLAVAGLALALPLAVRRTRPVLAAVLVGAALVAQAWLGGTVGFGSFLAGLVALFSVGRHVARTPDALAGALPVLAGGAVAMASSIGEEPAELFFPLFYTSAAWGLGRALRVLEQRSAQLRRYNEVLARDQETTARLAVAGERIRLARELHDVLAHTVMVMVWQAEEAEELLDSPDRARESLTNVQDAGRRGLAELRRLIDVLREDELDLPAPELSELPALTSLLSGSGLSVSLELDVPSSAVLPPGLGNAVYRLVQEALTNVLRHSHAEAVSVHVTASAGTLRCSVVDPGPRRTVPRPGSGHGLVGMQERVAPYGGTVEAGEDGTGFRVTAEVPLR